MKQALCLIILWSTAFAAFMGKAFAEQDYQTICAACHGDKGQGNAQLNSPALAGQSAAYLERQLLHFKQGVRGTHNKDALGKQMAAITVSLSDQKIKDLSAYLTKLEPNIVEAGAGDVTRGKKYYQSYCGSCHGSDGKGNDLLNAPNLTILSADYQMRQYQNFLNGVRGANKEDKFGRQMSMIATGLRDQDILADVIAYITQ